MSFPVLIETLNWNRQKTLGLIDGLAKLGDVQKALAWRPGPGRAHLAWQLMHIGATDDRHVHVRILGGQPQDGEYVRRFAGGSTPDDDIPTVEDIKRYLDLQRKELLAYFTRLDDSKLNTKPNDQAPWTHAEWLRVLAWHEAHHQGQAHLTVNLYKEAHGIK